MKIENQSKIPDALFRYLKADTYDHEAKGSSLSATEILNPTQVVVLRRRYAGKIVIDAIDRLWVMLGNGVHAILEKEEGIEKIERLKVEVHGREVSGKWDRIFKKKISDYKVTSAWTVVYRSRDEEWRKQLSIYRWLFFKVKGIMLDEIGSIIALLRDWSESKATGNYPAAPAVELEFNLLSIEETEKFVSGRVKEITKAEKLDDEKLPECSDEDRWWNEKKQVFMRCEKYCDVSGFCAQLKREKVAAASTFRKTVKSK